MNAKELHELRQALTQVNENRRDDQQEVMESLRPQFDHSCEFVELGPDHVEDDYPAFAHCFDLHKDSVIMEHKETIFSNHGFRYLEKHKWEWSWQSFFPVAHHFMERVDPKDVRDGDVVAYLAEPTENIREMNVIHMGRVLNGKIVSKWGRGKNGSSTNIWSHDVEHVPDSYEDKERNVSVAYFRPNRKEIAAYFLRGCELRTRRKHPRSNRV